MRYSSLLISLTYAGAARPPHLPRGGDVRSRKGFLRDRGRRRGREELHPTDGAQIRSGENDRDKVLHVLVALLLIEVLLLLLLEASR